MNFGTDEYNSETQELQGFSQDQWSTAMLDMDQGTRSRDSSTNLISPTSGSMDAVYGISGPSKDVNPSNYLYNTATASGSNSNTNSGSTSTTSFQNLFNNGNNMFPMDSSFDFMNNGFQDLTSNEYMKSAAAIQAAQNMFGSYALNNTAPTTAPPQALFQNNLQHIPIDQAPVYATNRSPSPLFELDGSESPELTEVQESRRRASESLPTRSTSQPLSSSKRRGYSISTPQGGRSHLDTEEKALRAAAGEGLNKGDKRRMQNKLAQRAFRARSKVVNKNAAGRLEHLEELTEQQASRIGHLTDLVGRLQKENYALKSSKFQEAMLKGGMPQ